MLDFKDMLLGCAAYVTENPGELWRAARKAVKLRFGLPVVALRWLAGRLESEKGPKDIEISVCPPGLRVAATVSEMDTWLRGSAVLAVQSVEASHEHLKVILKLSEVTLRVLGDSSTPLAALVRSGALDLSKVANLVAHLPQRPELLVEAVEDRLVLDFMRIPQLAKEPRARALIATIARLLQVESVATDDTHLEITLRAFPKNIGSFFT